MSQEDKNNVVIEDVEIKGTGEYKEASLEERISNLQKELSKVRNELTVLMERRNNLENGLTDLLAKKEYLRQVSKMPDEIKRMLKKESATK